MIFERGTGAEMRIIGRLGNDPVIHKTDSGLSFSNITLAVDKKNSTGEHTTEWFDFTLWSKQAENFVGKAHKGMRIYLEASLKCSREKVIDEEHKEQYLNVVKFKVKSTSFMDPIAKKDMEEKQIEQ